MNLAGLRCDFPAFLTSSEQLQLSAGDHFGTSFRWQMDSSRCRHKCQHALLPQQNCLRHWAPEFSKVHSHCLLRQKLEGLSLEVHLEERRGDRAADLRLSCCCWRAWSHCIDFGIWFLLLEKSKAAVASVDGPDFGRQSEGRNWQLAAHAHCCFLQKSDRPGLQPSCYCLCCCACLLGMGLYPGAWQMKLLKDPHPVKSDHLEH